MNTHAVKNKCQALKDVEVKRDNNQSQHVREKKEIRQIKFLP